MKKLIFLLINLFLLFVLISCNKVNTEINDDKMPFFITVKNTISTDIMDLTISMLGSEDSTEIDILYFGKTTKNFEI